MLEVAPKKSPVTHIEDAPEWMRGLPGFDSLKTEHNEDGTETAGFGSDGDAYASGTWRSVIVLPVDLDDIKGNVDPLLALLGLAAAAEHVNEKLTEVVRYCRHNAKTWTQIGEALGMSKHAAWERFSGED